MHISGRFRACLTVEQPSELCPGAAEQLELATRGVPLYKLTTMESGLGRGQHAEAWRGWVLPVAAAPHAPATRKRLVPHHGSI